MKSLTIIFTLILGLICSQFTFSKTLSPYDQGIKLYKEGKYEVALVFFERAFKENPLNSKLYFYLGNIYNHKKMFNKSVEAYKRGLELTSEKNKDAFLYNLARSYQGGKQYKEALQTFTEIEKRTDIYTNIYLYKGMIYFNLRNKEEAIKSWEHFLVKAPDNSQYQSVRKAIDLLKDKNFQWPVSPSEKNNTKIIYVANGQGVTAVQKGTNKTQVSEAEREGNKKLVEDKSGKSDKDAISEEEIKKREEQLIEELKKKEEEEANKGVDDSVSQLKVDSEDLKVKDQDKKEGKEYDEIER